MEHNIQDFSTLQKFGSFNQNARSFVGSSNLHNFGVVDTPQKVNSLAELMDVTHSKLAPQISSAPNISTGGVFRHTGIFCQHSQVEGNQADHTFGAGFLQDHILHGEGGHDLQEISSRLSVRKYNLNLPIIPEAGESSSSVLRSFPFGPITPDPRKQSKTINYQINEVPQHSVHETLTQGKCTQNNISMSLQPGYIFERKYSENNLISSPSKSAAFILSPNEVNNSDGENVGIDLNRTPQPRPPKRKKHRPKVVSEGKPKRTPKPPAANTHNGIPRVKRKYVRKNGIQSSETPVANVVETLKGQPTNNSSKRKLDFDLENGAEKKSEEIGELNCQPQKTPEDKFPFNLNLADHQAELDGPMTYIGDLNTHGRKKHHGETEKDFFVQSMNKIALQQSLLLENMDPVPPKPRDHTLNVIARCLNMQNASTNQSIDLNRCSRVNHCITNGGLGQRVIQSNTVLPNAYYNSRQSTLSTMPQLVQDLMGVTEIEGAKKLYSSTQMRHPRAISLMGSQFWSNEVSKMGHCNRDSGSLWKNSLYTGEIMNFDQGFHGTSSCVPLSVGTTCEQYFTGQIGRSKIPRRGVTATCDNQGQSVSVNPGDTCNKVARDWYTNYPDFIHKFQQQQVNICSERVAAEKTYHMPSTERRDNAPDPSVTNFINRNVGSVSQREPKPIPVSDNTNSADLIAVRKQTTAGQTSSNTGLQEQEQSKNKRSDSSSLAVLQEERCFSIDYITSLLKDLHIDNDAQNALVPYREVGAVVPYEEFDIVKKRKARPRVDLDPETNRLWNLLMGKDGGAEKMDSDKQKWWEEERKVFQGRVDSFIARMHLVQGDRRFSKWKGSVVDSVIGVFLTQNVSDHLSSSAFMSLAAKFPLKSTTVCCKTGGSPLIEHHEVRITHPDDKSYAQKILREAVYNHSYHSSVTSTTLSSECGKKNVTTEERTLLVQDHTKETQEHFILSQCSSESFVFKSYEDMRSSSGSNSENEDGCNLIKNFNYRNASEQVQQYQDQCLGSSHPYNGSLFGYQQLENAAHKQNEGLTDANNAYYPYPVLPSANYWPNLSVGLEKWEEDVLAFFGTESISSTLASTYSLITNETGVNHPHDDHIGQSSESIFTSIQDGGHKFQQLPVNNNIATPSKHYNLKTDFSDESGNKNDQHVINIHMESRIRSDPTGPDSEPLSTQISDICQKQTDDIGHEPTKMGGPFNSSHKQASNLSCPTQNARKKKLEKEKVESFDWDSLRKKVQSKDGSSRDRMDSLDYEALRKADVHEISDTIKERGMNNMLAERMKSFLNRLVKDHERIDLEWLRDVEPDKAKDYLLSIRGLGLKSVECVRLLTLHHLAFPVDTNVGRIAVRLGWVPLQPLPESLQLHLLELYPVLESIQKYLWPRLCKLDQETLYELHYQMITFGKVFCTKREPNCNACPMRGECRHFASAFASARLSLPGPEEKRIVSSDPPVASNKRPDVIMKLMPPLIASRGSIGGGGLTGTCQPLIEEPTTPEPPITEVSEKDVEDAFYEDPDEIPVIKLNVQEFTTNLQSFMKEQMEMGEADMSKAVVALSPDLASIPIPKLKLVNRLRTEHRVYELPDSHPLLNGMERREPDDPSPYLLAIWTPGETADSVQPPEITCSSQDSGGLCNNRTCFSCNSTREAHSQTVRGTILIPCRTAMRGSFPLNGTYFQVNEVFADHESSLNPIDVPRSSIWNLPRRTVFFGTSVSSIFKGLSTEDIQYCFWKGFVCVRGFDQKRRAPRPLRARLHLSPSKVAKQNE